MNQQRTLDTIENHLKQTINNPEFIEFLNMGESWMLAKKELAEEILNIIKKHRNGK